MQNVLTNKQKNPNKKPNNTAAHPYTLSPLMWTFKVALCLLKRRGEGKESEYHFTNKKKYTTCVRNS